VSLFEGVNKATCEPTRAQQESRVTLFFTALPAIVQHTVGCRIDSTGLRQVNGRAFV
jgi:hypothetical protein